MNSYARHGPPPQRKFVWDQGSGKVPHIFLFWAFAMADLAELQEYYTLADRLIDQSSKDELAECARLLAVNLAHYQGKYGELPLAETLAMLEATEPNEAQIEMLVRGMETLVGLLGNVMSGLGEEKH